MTPAARRQLRATTYPLRVFLTVLALTFSIEALIMLTMWALAPEAGDTLPFAVLDAFSLTALLSPCFWFLIVRPLRRVSEHRGRLLARVLNAQEEERARLSRDLHDELGQQLTAVLVGLRTVEQSPDLDTARKRAVDVRAIAAGSMEAVRRIARGLRSADLADLGLVPLTERLCEEVLAPAGMRAELISEIPPGVRLAPAIESAVFRIVQEGVTNIVRHGEATQATLRLALNGDTLTAEVTDNGRGFDPAAIATRPAGLGLEGMRERVALLDGTMELRAAPSAGTTLVITIPRVFADYEPS